MKIAKSPLEGLKVLELARVLAGPWAGQILADLGAQVIKVESPTGDETRNWGEDSVNNNSSYFKCTNRGKSSFVANFKKTRCCLRRHFYLSLQCSGYSISTTF